MQGFFDGQLIATVIADAVYNALRGCQQHIEICAVSHRRGVLITVEDDGSGYPAEILAIQGQHSVPSQHGSGLGLFFALSLFCSGFNDLPIKPRKDSAPITAAASSSLRFS